MSKGELWEHGNDQSAKYERGSQMKRICDNVRTVVPFAQSSLGGIVGKKAEEQTKGRLPSTER